jgi:hypothetical protein
VQLLQQQQKNYRVKPTGIFLYPPVTRSNVGTDVCVSIKVACASTRNPKSIIRARKKPAFLLLS